jgi:hypothetical protein
VPEGWAEAALAERRRTREEWSEKARVFAEEVLTVSVRGTAPFRNRRAPFTAANA